MITPAAVLAYCAFMAAGITALILLARNIRRCLEADQTRRRQAYVQTLLAAWDRRTTRHNQER